ncbi:hypothetical protein [Hyalangium rubrum]|uniref:Uncharacterized protein n=1 Tax=Hyalangium rubrum TaxID=3103134 RepID=A0ABU5HAB8_9BACT|nr:hypothetical protein [Hyalangium sp. s54d21]MDY7229768.1 hypothetical protein [Hyalangium sp. s54d21]
MSTGGIQRSGVQQSIAKALETKAPAGVGTGAARPASGVQFRDGFEAPRAALANLTGNPVAASAASTSALVQSDTSGTGALLTEARQQELRDRVDAELGKPWFYSEVLADPTLSQAERDFLYAHVASNPGNAWMFTGGQMPPVPLEQSLEMANGVARAYEQGLITDAQMSAFLDAMSPEEAASFIQQLSLNPDNCRPGGSVDRVAQMLLANAPAGPKGDGMRAAAYFALSSTPELAATIPEDKRAEAFTLMTNFLESGGLFEALAGVNPQLTERLNAQRYQALAGFYGTYGEQLVREASVPQADRSQVNLQVALADFFSKMVFAPEASNIQMPNGGTVADHVVASTDRIGAAIIDQVTNAAPGDERAAALTLLATLSGTVGAGADIALRTYKDELEATRESRERFAGLLGGLAQAITPPTVPGAKAVASKSVEWVASAALQRWIEDPEAPDFSASGALMGPWEAALYEASPEAYNDYSGVYAKVRQDIEDEINRR